MSGGHKPGPSQAKGGGLRLAICLATAALLALITYWNVRFVCDCSQAAAREALLAEQAQVGSGSGRYQGASDSLVRSQQRQAEGGAEGGSAVCAQRVPHALPLRQTVRATPDAISPVDMLCIRTDCSSSSIFRAPQDCVRQPYLTRAHVTQVYRLSRVL
jgi:hypothetical protein